MQVLAHNLAAQFTNRQLNITTNQKAKSSEKLSSGYRINRSADDAAGLSISEEMRRQIRGLNRASENIQDGISLCQVADGALGETTEMLQRMRVLSIQAANGTNSESDRSAIQQEIDQLTKEVDRIAETTSFNEEIHPLKSINDTDQKPSFSFAIREETIQYKTTGEFTIDGKKYNIGDMVSVTGITIPEYDYILLKGGVVRKGIKQAHHPISDPVRLTDLKCDEDGFVYYNYSSTTYYLKRTVYKDGEIKLLSSTSRGDVLGADQSEMMYLKMYGKKGQHADCVWIQAGAETGEGLSLSMVNATAKGLGIKEPDISVMSEKDCDDAMNRLDDAISKVSSYRSLFGAQQNRLECAKSVDDNTAENTTVAESRIRDTDMAKEMVGFSKNNILAQVGQSMLAQANQSTQGILSLLQ